MKSASLLAISAATFTACSTGSTDAQPELGVTASTTTIFEVVGEPLRPDPALVNTTTTQEPPSAEEALAELEEETIEAESIGGEAADATPTELSEDEDFLAETPTPEVGATSISFGSSLVDLESQTPALAGPPSWGGEVTNAASFEASILSLAAEGSAEVTELPIGYDIAFDDGSTGQLRHEEWLNWLYVAN